MSSLRAAISSSVGKATETSSGRPTSAPRAGTGQGRARGTAGPACRPTLTRPGCGYSTESSHSELLPGAAQVTELELTGGGGNITVMTGYPNGYSRVTAYLDFIEAITGIELL